MTAVVPCNNQRNCDSLGKLDTTMVYLTTVGDMKVDREYSCPKWFQAPPVPFNQPTVLASQPIQYPNSLRPSRPFSVSIPTSTQTRPATATKAPPRPKVQTCRRPDTTRDAYFVLVNESTKLTRPVGSVFGTRSAATRCCRFALPCHCGFGRWSGNLRSNF